MVKEPDVLVVGAGPAGLCAAIAVAEGTGGQASVLIADEGIELGGQLPKQTHKFFGHEGFFASVRGYEIGQKLVKRIRELGVHTLTQTTVTGIYEDGVAIYNRAENWIQLLKPKFLVISTGASEKFLAFKNNTLPGVYGAGAVQTLMNQYKVLPGRSFLIVGAGNIGLIVAYQLLQAGAVVKAIVEASDRVGGYEVHAAKVRRMGVPILLRHTVVEALGEQRVRGAVIARVDERFKPIEGTERELVVDAICLAVGLQPSVELVSQAGAKLVYIPELGGHVPLRDERMRTTVENVYVAGDLSGIEEATTAMVEGYIAGYDIAERISGVDHSKKIASLQKELEEFRRGPFSDKVRTGLMKLGLNFPFGGYRTELQKDMGPRGKLRAVIECPQPIPCNPCETSCPSGAISVGGNINGIPHVDYSKCTGCGVCVMKCPGLAIFMVQERADDSLVGVPYEFLPLPEKGQRVELLNRVGEVIGIGAIDNIVVNRREKTHLVYLSVPRGLEREVRNFRLPQRKAEYLCRCEEITREEVEQLIDTGITDYEELRRMLRIGMGPCGGRTCRHLVLNLIAEKTGTPVAEVELGAYRPPVTPVPFEAVIQISEEPNVCSKENRGT